MDPLLNAAVAAGLVEVGTACGFAVDPGQEAHGSCLQKTSELQDTFTFIFNFNIKERCHILSSMWLMPSHRGKILWRSQDVRCKKQPQNTQTRFTS